LEVNRNICQPECEALISTPDLQAMPYTNCIKACERSHGCYR
jgi:hypothetical protein